MSRVSIFLSPELAYPTSVDFSPDERYPEYPFQEIATHKNLTYAGIRELLRMSEADCERYSSPHWNPLGKWISKGDRVFVLPNFVTDRQPRESLGEFLGKCTHASVLRAVIDYALIAAQDMGMISFGNAPMQSCDYRRVLEETGARALADFYRRSLNSSIAPCDLRGLISRWSRLRTLRSRRTTEEETVAVDLGKDSLLEQLNYGCARAPRFRVRDYDPAMTESFHGKGRHVYVMNKRILESKVVISVPKLKTHEKVALTCALKGTVGTIARKECLAHWSRGGPKEGGDEHASSNWRRRLTDTLGDQADCRGETFLANSIRFLCKALTKVCSYGPASYRDGAWYGNDTAWRMTLDIARIIRYARVDGSMSSEPQRNHLAFIDGIIAGEGEGPLLPRPRNVGALLFSDDVAAIDYASALLMGFDAMQVPLVRNAFGQMSYQVSDASLEGSDLVVNHRNVSAAELRRLLPRPFQVPKGWIGHLGTETVTVESPRRADIMPRSNVHFSKE
ncbi:MAG: DUF362 domain-containing protein [Terriglobia bacterium]|jgi:uncharacterized protein (DUF362 family)